MYRWCKEIIKNLKDLYDKIKNSSSPTYTTDVKITIAVVATFLTLGLGMITLGIMGFGENTIGIVMMSTFTILIVAMVASVASKQVTAWVVVIILLVGFLLTALNQGWLTGLPWGYLALLIVGVAIILLVGIVAYKTKPNAEDLWNWCWAIIAMFVVIGTITFLVFHVPVWHSNMMRDLNRPPEMTNTLNQKNDEELSIMAPVGQFGTKVPNVGNVMYTKPEGTVRVKCFSRAPNKNEVTWEYTVGPKSIPDNEQVRPHEHADTVTYFMAFKSLEEVPVKVVYWFK